MTRKLYTLVGFVLLFVALCGSGFAAGPNAESFRGAADILQSTVDAYRKAEPRLTAAQRDEFKEAYTAICSAYQTAGVLLESVMDAADEPSARTAMFSYQRIAGELPNMVNKLAKQVRSYK